MAGLTQRQLAKCLGVSHMSISHWESARNEPSARQLRALAEAFGVPMERIAFERELAHAEIDAKRAAARFGREQRQFSS
jgi:transcriptional regulator with XRE-family HTH domain